jgi:pantoate--beta-alanine ligase
MAESAALTTVAMEITSDPPAVRERIAGWKSDGVRVGFVPTMGALHEGHLALVRRAAELTDKVVVSIFVNPTQFGPGEDFEEYPRNPERDAELLDPAGCDMLFLPSVETIYPRGHSTFVEVEGVSAALEGDQRPGHFRGVATVVTQLLNLVQPDVAVFGEKDAQQLAVVRRLVRDLHLPVEIEALPTVREPDGLAMSSRNAYLTPEDRKAATVLARALSLVREAMEKGERSAAAIRLLVEQTLLGEPRLTIDYVAVVDADSFQPIEYLTGRIVVPIAGRLGTTRLLDNLQIDLREIDD